MLINKKYFEYLIIDECGGATEPQTLIPIAEVVSSFGVIHANIVLSGDPQQLGPFVKNYSDDRLSKNNIQINFVETDEKYSF